jgi:class 3 adenylate cyclase
VNARTLYRHHLRLLLTGTAMHLAPLLLVVILTLHPKTPLALLLPFAGIPLTIIAEVVVLWLQYRPLRTLDALGSDHRYAQNTDLSKGVVLLHNLPFHSFLRVYLLRGILLAGCTHLLIVLQFSTAAFDGLTAAAFWLLALTVVPLLPASYEMFTLPARIDRLYQDDLSYRAALSPAWKHRIRLTGSGIRIVFVVFVLCAAPLIAVTLLPDLQIPGDPLLLASCVLTVGSFVAAFILSETQRSIASLLEGMRQVGRNRPMPTVSLNSGDEFSLAADGFQQMVAGLKEQSFIRDTFGKAVPKAIVEAVLRNGVKLHGERRSVAMMLVDIHRFRSRFDTQPAVETVSLLNEYLAAVSAAVQHFGGTIDKINGDRVLVVFGAPVTLTAPVERALFAALDVRKSIDRLNRRLEHAGCEPLHLAVTIHYGQVIAGHVGAAERWEYSVIGQAVNDTYAVGRVTRHHPVDIVATASARQQAVEQFQWAGPLIVTDEDSGDWEVYSVIDAATQSAG